MATSGDHYLATSGDFFMATDSYALMTTKQVFAYGLRTGVLRTNPAAEIKPPRKRKGDQVEVVPWTPEELRRFLQVADQDEWNYCWRLVACGLSRSEVCGLVWDNVDSSTGAVTIRQGRVSVGNQKWVVDDPKSEASWRTVYVADIHPGTTRWLRVAYLRAPDKTGFVVTDSLGVPPHPDTVTSRSGPLCQAADVRRIKPHALRHTLATIAHRDGVPAGGCRQDARPLRSGPALHLPHR